MLHALYNTATHEVLSFDALDEPAWTPLEQALAQNSIEMTEDYDSIVDKLDQIAKAFGINPKNLRVAQIGVVQFVDPDPNGEASVGDLFTEQARIDAQAPATAEEQKPEPMFQEGNSFADDVAASFATLVVAKALFNK